MNSRTQENVREVLNAMGDADGGRPIVVTLADVAARITEYLWPSRVPLSKLSIIIGDPGVGKSTLTLDIAARVSTGATWPDGGVAPITDVVLLSAEDALDDTIRPRLDRLGADVTKIHALIGIRDAGDQRLPNLARDVELLERVVLDRSARLVIIDPVSAYLGKTDSHRDAEVRGVLGPIAAMADRTGAAVLGVMHLNKSSQGPALYRAIGSIAFVAAARLVLAVAPHPEDPELRIVVPMKSNICKPAPALAYRIDDGRLVWVDVPVDGLDAAALLNEARADEHGNQTDAEQVIRELLADSTSWPLNAVHALEAGRQHGISDRTMQRTAKRLGIRIARVGFGRGGRWLWHRPGSAIDDAPLVSAPMSSMTPMEEGVSGMEVPLDDTNLIPDIPDIHDAQDVLSSNGVRAFAAGRRKR